MFVKLLSEHLGENIFIKDEFWTMYENLKIYFSPELFNNISCLAPLLIQVSTYSAIIADTSLSIPRCSTCHNIINTADLYAVLKYQSDVFTDLLHHSIF